MSWSGFKKNVGRATTQVMMKTGHVEKTSDREYEVEERRYRTLESASLRLQKEAKGYLDSLRAMTASQMRIAETIDAFYGDSGAKDGVSRSYKQAVEDLDAETVKALDGPYRCVPKSLYKFSTLGGDEGSVDAGLITIQEVEADWNFRAGNSRNYTRGVIGGRDCSGFESACELMEYVYRTTVLEPINRFCNYFTDINECIKKRNHKMLDYDSLRSKVRRLTEKPDKDPAKLPRTEKEMEMVSNLSSFDEQSLYPTTITPTRKSTSATSSSQDLEHMDLGVPSPSKVLQRPEILKLRREPTPGRVMSESTLSRRSSLLSRTSSRKSVGAASGFAKDGVSLVRSPTTISQSTAGATSLWTDDADHSAASLIKHSECTPRSFSCTSSFPSPTSAGRSQDNKKAKKSSQSIKSSRTPIATPFFQPSELEDIMQPLKEEFMKRQADQFGQAKATYEQLNEQLTNELPQLIDLRVPYLDPTFEALVKIQLRFCAEAYSRMAQVQQYLDASTRDQYASGDLDARVEDVLGQIRELSIAGTV